MTKTHYWTGTAEYAFLSKTNKYGNYSINFFPKDDTVRREIKAAGFRGGVKESPDGRFYYIFRRREKDGSPDLIDADGNVLDAIVGNGSTVTVKVQIYDFKEGVDKDGQKYAAGKGSRLEAVRVDELVPYEPKEKPEQAEGEAVPF